MKELFLTILLAANLWLIIFSPWTAGRVPFWPAMTISAFILAAWAVLRTPAMRSGKISLRRQHLVIGLLSAMLLYAGFWLGHLLATSVMPGAADEVRNVYKLRETAPLMTIVLLLLVIAPAEEIFWRGFVQRRLTGRFGPGAGCLLAALIYAGVHLWALNLMLLAAALLCGLAWGMIFWKSRSLWPGIISHLVWDLTIFVLLPIS